MKAFIELIRLQIWCARHRISRKTLEQFKAAADEMFPDD